MTPLLDKLLSLLAPALGAPLDAVAVEGLRAQAAAVSPSAADALADLLTARNGAQGFEGALTLPPVGDAALGLETVNAVWKASYGAAAEGCLLFGWNGLGDACVLTPDGTGWFDAETGEIESTGPSLESWAADLLVDYEMRTAHPLARAWQELNGRLAPGQLLAPIRPFVLGGTFTVDNLRQMPLIERLREGGRLAQAIASLPDGAALQWPLSGQGDGITAH
jgi:hypothetical protein